MAVTTVEAVIEIRKRSIGVNEQQIESLIRNIVPSKVGARIRIYPSVRITGDLKCTAIR